MKKIMYSGSDGCSLAAWKTDPAGDLVSVLLHGGGPDHYSLAQLARKLSDLTQVIVPDIRGYGVSVCTDPDCHTWKQYAEDIQSLLDHLNAEKAVVGGTGLGATISLRFALALHPAGLDFLEPQAAQD